MPSNVKREMSNIILKMYDLLGKEVATLVNELKSPGIYEIVFDASDLASGIYYYRLKSWRFHRNKEDVTFKVKRKT